MEPSRLQLIALVASIVLATASASSLLFGVCTYRRNANAQLRAVKTQLQLTAFRTLQHYFDLAVEHPDLASRDDEQPVETRYAWFAGTGAVHGADTSDTGGRRAGLAEGDQPPRAQSSLLYAFTPFRTLGLSI